VDRSAEKENGVSVFLFSGVWVVAFVAFVALLRSCIRRAVLVLTKIAPRLALQLAQDPTIPDLSYGSPPAANSIT
jgi:hypothetical protein